MAFSRKFIGHGIGMRPKHYGRYLEERPPIDWMEVISENFMVKGGRPLAVLEKVRREVPVVLHGVSLAIGSVDPLNRTYLRELRELADRVEPAWVSDHLCWGTHRGEYAHDLLPFPYTQESLAHLVDRVNTVQDALRRQILLENASSYVTFRDSTIPEWEFLAQLAERADCGILLDVNNVYVSSKNHGWNPHEYLRGIPVDRVGQFHLAGHSDKGTYLLDTHDGLIIPEVWSLYAEAVRRFGRVSSLIEWDEQVPEIDVLIEESHRARDAEAQALQLTPPAPE
jgi:uncharacterized protein (UPF0276 family)